jgi:phosphoglycolate phosphatase
MHVGIPPAPLAIGVFFDFDGTLIDSRQGIIEGVQRLRAECGAGPLPPLTIQEFIGWGVRHLVAWTHPRFDPLRPDRLPPPDGEPPFAAAQLDRLVKDFRRIYGDVMLQEAVVYPGVAQLCQDLEREGASLAVISNKPERFVRQILAAFALADPFTLIIGGDTLPETKPHPRPLQVAAERMRLPLSRCMMVGDGPLDVHAAHAAAIRSCAVTWGFNDEAKLRALNPTAVAHSAAELHAWLRSAWT